ncbi:LysE family translocator [Yoonia sediminilitoris]|uniref:Threonine/homoserine/homoserine lactone efflux protein n=1 Tax=Yoonia sediminilitoris TaxID=1286148 RepID=A0A2T6KQY2_9RHOB|nr:LysE family transporter [Yoonia sediminilitoris]PUB18960.1 threonine/homoserine/homoserine lactone efflux protein [Yoonia sediminilitoris]RCW99128.1 threonine/homoserine/homoserine lactone efflux protein [Yoonia sediminilitoris]
MITFALAVFFLIATPGPGVLSTAGVGAGYGFGKGLRYVAGLFLGTNIVALGVITGLAAIVLSVPVIRWVLMAASLLYLLYLAARIAFAGSKIAFIAATVAPGIGAGVLLQAINPKAYAVNTSLFTGFPYAPENLTYETITKLLIVNAIWIPIHLAWLWAGASLHRLNLSDSAQRKINYAMAASMLAVVALALISGLRAA